MQEYMLLLFSFCIRPSQKQPLEKVLLEILISLQGQDPRLCDFVSSFCFMNTFELVASDHPNNTHCQHCLRDCEGTFYHAEKKEDANVRAAK